MDFFLLLFFLWESDVGALYSMVRKFFEKFWFIMAGSGAEPRAQCVECGEILLNEAVNRAT